MRLLSGFDAMFVYDEGPEEPQHTLKVCFLGEEASRAHDFESAKAALGARLARLPLLRWRVARIPFDLHHPVWVEAGSIDLDHHVRHRQLPDGAGREELCRAISEIASEPLDPERPLWETWFLEGYEGDRVVIVMKVSHALADGASFVALFEHALFSRPTDPEVAREIDQAVAEAAPPVVEQPGRASLFWLGVLRVLRDTFIRIPRLLKASVQAHRRLREARDRIPRPKLSELPQHAFGGPLSRRRAFYFTTVPLASAKEIAKTFDSTINDVVLAVVAGAVRIFLAKREALPDSPLIGTTAASIRRPDERNEWGNRVTSRTLRLATHLADPVERLRYSRLEDAEVKRDVALHAGADISDWIALIPPFVLKGGTWLMRRLVRRMPPPGSVIVANVRGPASTLYTTRGPIENIVSVGNVKLTVSLNITVWSYVDKLNFGIYTCGEAFPNLGEVADDLDQAFAELADAAQRHRSHPQE